MRDQTLITRYPGVAYRSRPVVLVVALALTVVVLAEGRASGQTPSAPVVQGISAAPGGEHVTCARSDFGTVTCWGGNENGELGNGVAGGFTTVGAPVAGLASVAQVDVGRHHSCALRDDGTVRCWGANGAGELGDGSTTARPHPVGVGSPLPAFFFGPHAVALALGDRHSCALTSDGQVWCWGANDRGQLGDGTMKDSAIPVEAKFPGASIQSIAAGDRHTCAARTNGSVWCWGANDAGQLGRGGKKDAPKPKEIELLSGAVQVAAGAGHTCIRTTTGAVWCWGANDYGQSGHPREAGGDWRPSRALVWNGTEEVPFVAAAGPAAQFMLGREHTCARRADETVWCWGRNNHGQLGNRFGLLPPTPSSETPAPYSAVQVVTPLGALRGVQYVAGGDDHVCARTYDGAVHCWGRNDRGQLGDGTIDPTDHGRAWASPALSQLDAVPMVDAQFSTVDGGAQSNPTRCREHEALHEALRAPSVFPMPVSLSKEVPPRTCISW